MLSILKKYSHIVHFLPGILILCFGMIGLHASVRLDHTFQVLESYQKLAIIKSNGSTDEKSVRDHEITGSLSEEILGLHQMVYWSIIAISLSGFLLLILNADKLTKLEKLNEERKENLRQLEYRSAAVEASLEGIGIVDKNGDLVYMNKALMTLHGLEKEDLGLYIGKSWLNLYTPKGREQVELRVMPELLEKGYWRGISPIVKHGGKVVRADMSLTRLSDGGFIGTARDITAEEQAELEKRDMMDQLYQAQKMEAIGRLAGGIAHDFNNILAAMNGYAEFLVEDLPENSQQNTFAKNILQAGRQARSLVDKILAFSRRKESDTDVIDLRLPLEESLSMLQASLPKSIELQTRINVDRALVNASATQISQVVMNLCVNARDAMENEKGKLLVMLSKISSSDDAPLDWVSESLPDSSDAPLIRIDDIAAGHTRLLLGQLARDHDYVCLSVEDTGCGMSRVIMEHIFEPFFTTKPVDKGTGLGLSTVHGVIANHAGAMMINSIIGKGTRFDLYFPVAKGEVKKIDTEVVEKAKHAGGKILLVEDQIEVQQMTKTMLERLGYEAQTASTGLEALDILREKPNYFDLVLTDQNMPKMTGLDLVLQVHYDFPDLPFVLLSGYSQEKLQEIMEEHPAIHAVIRKPITQQALGQTLAEVLSATAAKSKVA